MKRYSAKLSISNEKQKKDINPLNIIGWGFTIFAIAILILSFRWQILENDRFILLAKQQHLQGKEQATGRGTIYAADGSVLAVDQPAWIIYASLSSQENERKIFFEQKNKYITTVSAILNIDSTDLEKKLTDDFRYIKIAEGVSTEKKNALENAEIFIDAKGNIIKNLGLYYEKTERRVYPDGTLASHIIGFMGKDSNGNPLGQYGLEGFFFKDLTGLSTSSYQEKDYQGNVILTAEYQPVLPRDGKSIKLTINPTIQKKVQDALEKGVKEHQAKSGSAIIMNPKTGEIIAMANYPTYNPNEYWKTTDSWIFKNRAISDVYEYGSVHKPITVAIALESGKVKKDYICNDDTGKLKVVDATIYTWNKQPSGKLSLGGMLEQSNNPCLARVALETGHQYYYPKLQEFGFGKKIGIGLQEEETGYLLPYEYWTKVDLATTSFGQSISATALQVLGAINTIANEGKRMKPYIISEIIENDNSVTKYQPQLLAQPISVDTAKHVATLMEGVVRKGESRAKFNRDLPNYSVAGKTGTAQIPRLDGPGYYDGRTNTTFVGFSPVENAKMSMIVRLEEPGLDTYSFSTVVPVWIDIFKTIADDLEIPRTK